MRNRVVLYNGKEVIVQVTVKTSGLSSVLIATRPHDLAHTCRQYFQATHDKSIPLSILESAAGCLYPELASHDLWGHGSMG